MKTVVVGYSEGSEFKMWKYANLAKFCGVSLQQHKINKNQVDPRCFPASGLHDLDHLQGGVLALKIFLGREEEKDAVDCSAIRVLEETTFLQWISFAESELLRYQPESRQFFRSLRALEDNLKLQPFLSGEERRGEDVYLSSLLVHTTFNREKYPNLASWSTLCLQDMEPSPQPPPRSMEVTTSKEKSVKGAVKGRKKEGRAGGEDGDAQPSGRLQILCLHGYRQSGPAFRSKLGSFRKMTGKLADFTFITAPNQICEDEYGWWFSDADRTYEAHQVTDCEAGLKETLELISETCRTKGPFHGLMAFSQGAALGGTISVLQELGRLDFTFQFYIMVAGFISRTRAHKQLFQTLKETKGGMEAPSLHVFGSTDKVIECSMSEELVQFYNNPDIIRHEGGHFVPTSPHTKHHWTEFLKKMQNNFVK